MFKTYDRLVKEFKDEQNKIRVKYIEASIDDIKSDYGSLLLNLKRYDYITKHLNMQKYSIFEIGGIWLFLIQFNMELNKIEKVDWNDRQTCINILSAAHGYKSLLNKIIGE